MAAVSNLIVTVGDEQRANTMALMLDGASVDSASQDAGNNVSSTSLTSVLSTTSALVKGIFGHRSSRGFLTYTGRFHGRPVSIVAIGMGYPNMDFFVRELKAIVRGPVAIVRVGTCGAIAGGTIGMVSVPTDGAVMVQRNYDYPFVFSNASMENLVGSDQQPCPYRVSRPYSPDSGLTNLILQKASHLIGKHLIVHGLHASSDSFYASQGRPSREFLDTNSGLIPTLIQRGVKTVEMETAQLFHLAACIANPDQEGIRAAAIHAIIADRLNNKFLTNAEDRLRLDQVTAQIALEALVALDLPNIEDQLTVL